MTNTILHGDCIEKIRELPDNSVDSIVTDPPYELGFMGKSWDNTGIANNIEMWTECLRVLKPGGHLLAFSGTRTYHRMAVAIEDAGFEVRDMIEWIYGCLSEDTEILTESGYKFFKDISKDEKICIYNKDNNSYSYERPEKWSSYKVENEDCYSIKSDDTDQIVSKNHRCLVERNGKLEFEFAENLREKEIVPLFEGNKVYNRDCLEVMKTLEDKSIDMALTSPPYDNLRDYKGYTFNFEGIAKEIYRVLKDGGVCVWIVGDATIKGSETGTSFRQALYFKEIGFNLFDTIIYQKRGGLMTGSIKGYSQKFEYMFVFSKNGYPKTINLIKDLTVKYTENRTKKHRKKDGSFDIQEWKCGGVTRRHNIWIYDIGLHKTTKDKLAFQHPAIFPEKLAEDHILSWSNEGDTILDPMAGSGTTLKMAKKNNRNYIGIEIAPEYVDIINQRLQDKPKTTEATITKIKYSGIIFCPTVSTGAFVARRNGQVFITGNSGFPKSLNIGKAVDKLQGNEREIIGEENKAKPTFHSQNVGGEIIEIDNIQITKGTSEWEGWGTALKPAHEPICMARKPLAEKTVAENCLKYGTGGINIDESRVAANWKEERPESWFNSGKSKSGEPTYDGNLKSLTESTVGERLHDAGRFPANLIHDNSEEVRGCFPETKSGKMGPQHTRHTDGSPNGIYGKFDVNHELGETYGDSGNASRFFKSIIYQAKASKSERNKGCEGLEEKAKVFNGQSDKPSEDMKDVEKRFTTLPKANNHPTVKPIALMEYLIKMVTPNGGIVLDPFAGSGSTLVAAKKNGYQYIGIEMTEEYIPIIEARLK